jgi:quinolinate synthase
MYNDSYWKVLAITGVEFMGELHTDLTQEETYIIDGDLSEEEALDEMKTRKEVINVIDITYIEDPDAY